MKLNINTAAVVKYSNMLVEMHRSVLPIAVRTALNKAAFDVKQNTMPETADKTFTKRKPNFFKANSKVEPAKGFDIKTMESTVGFVSLGKNKAVDELKEQEKGGTIEHRSLIPMDTARTANSQKGMVRANARLAAIRGSKAINAMAVKGTEKKSQRFIKAAIKAKELNGKNAFVLGNKNNGSQTLSRIDKITFNKKKRTIKIKRTPLYTYRFKGKIHVARTNFMKRASMESGLSIEKHYVDAALKQFKKLTRK